MTLRLPLYARFVGWFLLNLILLTAVFWIVVRSEFRMDVLMTSLAGDRVQQLADAIYGELRTRPRNEWDDTLARFGTAYGVDFILLGDRHERLAGADLELPENLRERVRGFPGPRPEEGQGPPPMNERRPGSEPGRRPPGGRPEMGPPRFFVRTTEPTAYWAIIRAPLGANERGRGQLGRLVVRSKTLSAGGLFFEATPWFLAGGAVVIISVLWWIPFVGSITRSVRQMTAATEQIAEGRFDVAVNERRTDELGRLGGAINRMSGRLAGFVTGQKRFLGDIAHELCSPLARMEMGLGVLDQRASEPQREYLGDVRDEVRHMSELVNELLVFSKAGLKPQGVALSSVALARCVRQVIERETAADDRVQVAVADNLYARADPDRLGRALGNLIRNALRYAGKAGPVTVTAVAQGDELELTVADEGPGVPEAALARLGEPFFRPDAARGRETGGTGLGLAIVRTCVEACGGKLTLQNRQPRGFAAVIRLASVRPEVSDSSKTGSGI